ncbi:hypothetical protein VTP01DRAFT_3846 [Rhizomucor pusillus]|uniref:uncharacterized protein n=1 Tax=Rhizomucor pusillus TaxID=4840 RepID=UPI0037447209
MELAILLDLDLEYEQRSPYFSSIQALIVSGLTVRVRIVRDALFEKMPGDAKDEQRSVAADRALAATSSTLDGSILQCTNYRTNTILDQNRKMHKVFKVLLDRRHKRGCYDDSDGGQDDGNEVTNRFATSMLLGMPLTTRALPNRVLYAYPKWDSTIQCVTSQESWRPGNLIFEPGFLPQDKVMRRSRAKSSSGSCPKTSDHSLETLEEIKDGCEHRFATACNVVTV